MARITVFEQANYDIAILFPFEPSQVPETGQAAVRSFNVLGDGGHSLPIGRAERHFPLTGYFPGGARRVLPQVHNWRPPQAYADQIRDWMERKARLRYQVFSAAGSFDCPVYISRYQFTRTGWAGDLNYDLEFVEWRQLQLLIDNGSSSAGVASGQSNEPPGATQAPVPEPPLASTYTVQPGDTLSFIARKLLGDSGRWRDLAAANTDTIDDPSLIFPGQVIQIPGGTAPATDIPLPVPADAEDRRAGP